MFFSVVAWKRIIGPLSGPEMHFLLLLQSPSLLERGKGAPPKPTLFPPLLGRPATEAEAQAAVLQNRRNICRSPQNESKKRVNYV